MGASTKAPIPDQLAELATEIVTVPAALEIETEPGIAQCVNCGADPRGPFCAHCGQDQSLEKGVSVKGLASELVQDGLNLERKLLRTLRQLLINPGVLAREYVEGRRTQYVRPVALWALTAGVYFGAANLFPTTHMATALDADGGSNAVRFDVRYGRQADDVSQFEARAASMKENEGKPLDRFVLERQVDAFKIVAAYTREITAISIPLYALLLWLFNRSFRRSYWDYLVLGLYLNAADHVVLLATLSPVGGGPLLLACYFAAPFLYAFVGLQTFHRQNRVKLFLKTLAAWVLFQAMVLIVTSLVGGGLLVATSFQELRELVRHEKRRAQLAPPLPPLPAATEMDGSAASPLP